MFLFASKFRTSHSASFSCCLFFPFLLLENTLAMNRSTHANARAGTHLGTHLGMHTDADTDAHEGTLAGTNVGTHFGMYLGMHQGNKRRCTYRHTYRVIDADAYADTLLGTHASILADADKDAGRLTTARVNRYATATNSATRLFLEFYGDSLLLTF